MSNFLDLDRAEDHEAGREDLKERLARIPVSKPQNRLQPEV